MFRQIKLILASKLHNRFITFFTVLAVVPLLILGGLTIYLIDLSHKRDVSNLELQLIDQKTEEVGKFFADTLGVLELKIDVALSEAGPEESGTTSSWQERLIGQVLQSSSAFEEVSFIDLQGKERAKKSRSTRETELENVSELDKFRKALDGENYISDPYYTLKGPFISMSSPVEAEGRIIQVLSAEVNLSQLARKIESTSLGTSGYIVLLDRAGSIIGQKINKNMRPGLDLSRLDRVKKIMEGQVLTGLESHDRYLSAITSVPVVGAGKKIPKLNWILLAEWPLEEADAIIHLIRDQVFKLTLAFILIVLMVAPFFASHLLFPIKELQVVAAAIEEGNFEKKVEIKTADELEELGVSFNKMVSGLRRLKELQDEFVFVAAHELRSPVTVIRGYISMILGGDAGIISEKVKAYLTEADNANKRLLQLVSDLLEVARSEAGRISIAIEPIDITETAKITISELKLLADEKSITLTYDPPGNLPKVYANTDKVKEVMVNLAGNAIKYTQNGGSVMVSHEMQNGELITHIKDNGFGISQEAQKKLFEKFYRVQTDQTRKITGTGLGLFIVKQLVEKMNGKIRIVSEEGKGSTFSFSLRVVS